MYLLEHPHPRHDDDGLWTATGHERPVFLDEHGRRRRWVLLGGALGGGASACWLGALVAGAIGFSTLPSVQQGHSAVLAARSTLVARSTVPATRSTLVAERGQPWALVQRPAAGRHRARTSRGGHSSDLGHAAELALSAVVPAAR